VTTNVRRVDRIPCYRKQQPHAALTLGQPSPPRQMSYAGVVLEISSGWMSHHTRTLACRVANLAPLLMLGLAVTYAATRLVAGPAWTVDDAFIVARYARNLVEHGSLTWNIGESPVEGFTGLVLPALMALSLVLGLSPFVVVKAISAAALFLGAWFVYRCRPLLETSRLSAAFSAALYLTAGEQFVHAGSALETEIFATLTLGCVWAHLGVLRAGTSSSGASIWLSGPTGLLPPLLATGCALTRPEGMLVAVVLVLGTSLVLRPVPRGWWWRLGLGFALPVSLVQLLRVVYFGDWLPNTYYAKLHQNDFNSEFLHDATIPAWWYLGLALCVAAGLAILTKAAGANPETEAPWSTAARTSRRLLLGCSLLIASVVTVSYSRSALAMNFSERFLFHFFGLFMLVLQLTLDATLRRLKHIGAWRPRLAPLVTAIVVSSYVSMAVHAVTIAAPGRALRASYAASMQDRYVPIARWLKDNLPGDALLACYPDAGIVPYLTGLRTVDFGRLNDRYLAREALTAQDVVEYFFKRDPDALVLSHIKHHAFDKAADLLLEDVRFSRFERVHFDQAQDTALSVYVKR
jgi:arabinofuranosyltransferase